MAVKKKVEAATTKKVKNYGKEYIQSIKLDVENSKPMTLTFEQLAEKLTNNKRHQTEVKDNFIYTTAPTGFWKHNLPSEASFSVTGKGFVINIY